MTKKSIYAIIFAMIIFSVTIMAVQAEDINSTDLIGIDDNSIDKVVDDMNNANDGDVITLEDNYFKKNKTYGYVKKSVTLQGNNAEINLNNSYYTLNIDKDVNLTVKDLKFVEGNYFKFESINSSLTLINCSFIDCDAIMNGHGNLTIINSTFNNTRFNVIRHDWNIINIYNSKFNGDVYENLINLITPCQEINIYDSYFENKQYSLITLQSASNVNFINNTLISHKNDMSSCWINSQRANISKNTFKGVGKSFELYINEFIFNDNNCSNVEGFGYIKCPDLIISNSNFSGQGYYSEVHGNKLKVLNSNFKDCNQVQLDLSSKIFEIDKSNLTNTEFYGYDEYDANILDCNFIKSTIFGSVRNAIAKNSNFDDAGFAGSNVVIDNCSFKNNQVISFETNSITNSNFTNIKSFYFTNGGSLTIDNCNFNENTGDYIFQFNLKTLKIINSRFTNNQAQYNLFSGTVDNLIVTNNIISNNKAVNLGTFSCPKNYKNALFQVSENIFINNNKQIPGFRFVFGAGGENDKYEQVNLKLGHNFYGYNIYDEYELTDIFVFQYLLTKTWVNLNVNPLGGDNYQLIFKDNAGNTVSMKECSFSLKNKQTGEVILSNILVKNGVGQFKLPSNTNINDLYIITEAGTIVNNPPVKLIVTTTGNTYADYKVTITVLDSNNNPIKNGLVKIVLYNYVGKKCYKDSIEELLNSKGQYVFDDFDPQYDHFKLEIMFGDKTHSLTVFNINNIKLNKAKATVSIGNIQVGKGLYTNYNLKTTFKNVQKNVIFTVKVYKNSKLKDSFDSDTKSLNRDLKNAFAKLPLGTYKVVLIAHKLSKYTFSKKTFKVKLLKPAVTKAKKITAKYKKSKKFKITVKDKKTKKAIANIKLKVKVYTKNKFKTYTVKTNGKGIATLNTKKIKVGTHKVEISSNNGRYGVYAKSQIKIKK